MGPCSGCRKVRGASRGGQWLGYLSRFDDSITPSISQPHGQIVLKRSSAGWTHAQGYDFARAAGREGRL